jgi:hypothetical protein
VPSINGETVAPVVVTNPEAIILANKRSELISMIYPLIPDVASVAAVRVPENDHVVIRLPDAGVRRVICEGLVASKRISSAYCVV